MSAELKVILSIINSLLSIGVVHIFLVCLLGERYKRKVIYFLVLFPAVMVNFFLSIHMLDTIWLPFFSLAFCFAYSIFLFRGSFLQRCFVAGLIIAYTVITETLSVFIVSWIRGYDFVTITMMGDVFFLSVFLTNALMFIVFISITKLRKTNLLMAPIKRMVPLFVVVLICTFLSVMNGLFAIEAGVSVTLPRLLAEVAIFVLSLLVFYIYKSLTLLAEKEMHNERLEQRLIQDNLHFQEMDNHFNEIRTLKHDFVNHLTNIRALISKRNYDELDCYANQYWEEGIKVLSEVITGLPSVDTFISIKRKRANDLAIKFLLDIKGIEKIKIAPVHLNTILANTLDNAIEACQVYKGNSSKKIELSLKMKDDYFLLKVINTSNPIYFEEGTLPRTTKQDKVYHGWGLESTKRVVFSYGGELHCEYKDGNFVLRSRLRNISCAEMDS